MNKLLIMIIEKFKEIQLDSNKKIQRNDLASDGKSDYERARRNKFLSMNEFSLMVRKKNSVGFKKKIQHNVITSD